MAEITNYAQAVKYCAVNLLEIPAYGEEGHETYNPTWNMIYKAISERVNAYCEENDEKVPTTMVGIVSKCVNILQESESSDSSDTEETTDDGSEEETE